MIMAFNVMVVADIIFVKDTHYYHVCYINVGLDTTVIISQSMIIVIYFPPSIVILSIIVNTKSNHTMSFVMIFM